MNPETTDQTQAAQTQAAIASLKSQVFTLLMALIVLSGTLTVFLYRQASLASADLVQARKVNMLVVKNEQVMRSFVSALAAYGQKHPDFQDLLKQHGFSAAPVAPAAAVKK